VPTSRGYTFDHLAEIIGQFTEQVGLKKFAIYIFDYGVPTGFRLALKYPVANLKLYISTPESGCHKLRQLLAKTRRQTTGKTKPHTTL
jgi:pimeloyl-ACP methyl ester carboxylesterase